MVRRTAERIAIGVFRKALWLLPSWLRQRAGEEMVSVFGDRQRRATGAIGLLGAWAVEFRGVLWTALRARVDRDGTLRPGRSHDHTRTARTRMDSLSKDAAFAFRTLRRRPTTAVVAIVTLGLGIAASTAMFSVVDAVLLAELPYPEPDRVVRIYPTNPSMDGHPTLGDAAQRGTFSPPEYGDLVQLTDGVLESFALVAAWGSALVASPDGSNERIRLGHATHEFLGDVLRVRPLIGRLPDRADADQDRSIVVLTEGFWIRRFGADPAVLGSTLSLNGSPFEIIGVIPGAGDLPAFDYDVELWQLLQLGENRGDHGWNAFGRLAPGVTPERASAQLSAAFQQAVDEHHDHGINVFPERAEQVRRVEAPLLLLTAAALLLLLVACGNVAVLLVGVALDRQRELAVRGALGAGRGRLFQQLLTEALVLSGAGAMIGVLGATAATRALVFLAPGGVPRIEQAGVDWSVLAFAAGAALLSGVVSGILPSMVFSKEDFRGSMASARGSTDARARLQGTVVVAEIAMATVLLVGGGLLVRTVLALNAIDPGFDAGRALSVGFSLPSSEILQGVEGDTARYLTLEGVYASIAEEVTALPGVTGAAYTSVLPLSPGRGNNYVRPEEWQEDDEPILAERRFVTPGYFEVLGIDMVEGRTFTPDDDRSGGPGVMVVSEGLARTAWPGQSAIGRRMIYWERETTVVGVAEDVHDEDLRSGTDYAFYVPTHQADQGSGTLVVRVEGDPGAVIPAVRQRIWSVAPGAAIHTTRPMAAWISDQIAGERYRARLAVVFALLAGFFSLMGIYAVTSRTVVARTREIGIRLALGAERAAVLRGVLVRAGRLAVFGALVGIAISAGASRFLEGFLFGVEPMDPATLVGVALALAGAAVVAAYAPGRRATRVDPVRALRSE